MTTQVRTAEPLVVITHPDFTQGYQRGRDWYFHGEAEGEIDDAYLVENIVVLAERKAHLRENRNDLYWHVGFLMGMVSGKFIPEP